MIFVRMNGVEGLCPIEVVIPKLQDLNLQSIGIYKSEELISKLIYYFHSTKNTII